jgi:hypothetical protein
MKQFFLLFTVFSLAAATTIAQSVPIKPVVKLTVPGDMGSNSGSVVWHPVFKRYYTAIIGNASYTMAIFDAKGKLLEGDIDAEYDYRGMWYNPSTKRIEFNCYDSAGWGHLELSAKGGIVKKVLDMEGMNQPKEQSVGVCMGNGETILFLNEEYDVVKYNAKTGAMTGTLTRIYAGCTTKNESVEMDLEQEAARWQVRNLTALFTGIRNAELAILNVEDKTIELYSAKTGLLTKRIRISDGVTLHVNFNFSYSNGIWWFFDKAARTWVGCK